MEETDKTPEKMEDGYIIQTLLTRELSSVFIKNVSILLSPQYGKLYYTVCAERVYVYFWKVGVAHIYCAHECVFNISLLLMWNS